MNPQYVPKSESSLKTPSNCVRSLPEATIAAKSELNAAGNVNFDMGRFGIEFVASPRHADGIVITGPITENMAEALQICYDASP